jgi:hypothetical protein
MQQESGLLLNAIGSVGLIQIADMTVSSVVGVLQLRGSAKVLSQRIEDVLREAH